jgi:uncharacterized protein (DUF1919 family)
MSAIHGTASFAVLRERDRSQFLGLDLRPIVANDCWGGTLCEYLGRPYCTPFVGLYLPGPSFAEVVSRLDELPDMELRFPQADASVAPHPVGILDDSMEIRFVHYRDQDEAADAWHRRIARFDPSLALIKLSGGKDGVTERHLQEVAARSDALALVAATDGAQCGTAVERFSTNGVALFYSSLAELDVLRWATGLAPAPSQRPDDEVRARYRALEQVIRIHEGR